MLYTALVAQQSRLTPRHRAVKVEHSAASLNWNLPIPAIINKRLRWFCRCAILAPRRRPTSTSLRRPRRRRRSLAWAFGPRYGFCIAYIGPRYGFCIAYIAGRVHFFAMSVALQMSSWQPGGCPHYPSSRYDILSIDVVASHSGQDSDGQTLVLPCAAHVPAFACLSAVCQWFTAATPRSADPTLR